MKQRLPFLALFSLPMVVVLFLFRAYFSDRFPAHVDTLTQFFPYFTYLTGGGHSLTQGLFSGFPLTTSPMSVLSPFTYPLLLILSPYTAYKTLIVLYMLLTYVCSYLYARRIFLSAYVSIFVATTFTLCGQLLWWADTVPNAAYYPLLPLSLYLLEVAKEKTRYRRVAFLCLSGIALGIGWISGHPQYIVYMHGLVGLYAVWCLRMRLSVLIPFGISALVGLWRIVATLDFQPLTARASGVDWAGFFIHAYHPHDLIHYMLPFFTIPTANPNSFNLYIGILPFIFLVCAFFVHKKIGGRYFYFFLAAFVFCLIASFKYSPLAYLLHALPLFSSLRGVSRIMFLGDFAAAMLAGFVLTYITEQREVATLLLSRISRVVTWVSALALVAMAAVTLLYVFFAEAIAHVVSPLISLVHAPGNAASIVQFILKQCTFFNYGTDIALLALLVSTLLLRRYARGALSTKEFLVASIGFLCINLAAVYPFYFKTVSAETFTTIEPTVAFVQKMMAQTQSPYPVRVYAYEPTSVDLGSCPFESDEEYYLLDAAEAAPDSNLRYGLDTLTGYDNYEPQSVIEQNDRMSTLPLSALADVLRQRNVQYVFSTHTIGEADFTPVFSAPIGECKTKVTVYELKGTYPRYFLGNPTNPLMPSFSDASVMFTVHATTTSPLFMGNTYLPRWRATIDGTETSVEKTDLNYMRISVPEGEHTVVFTYTPALSF